MNPINEDQTNQMNDQSPNMETANSNANNPNRKEIVITKKQSITFGAISLIALLVFIIVSILQGVAVRNKTITYDQLISDIKENKVEKIVIDTTSITLKYKDSSEKIANINNSKTFSDFLYSKDGLAQDPTKLKVEIAQESMPFSDVLGWVFQLLLLAGLGIIAWRLIRNLNDSGSKIFGFGETKAKIISGKRQKVTFDSVAGLDEARDELNEVVMFLKDPERFMKIGARIPKGILMVGAPGTGKTLLARAIAGEAQVPFFSTSGSEFEEMLVGAGASRVRDLFAKAKKVAPSLIFIDEIDAVGKRRGTTIQSSSTEQTLNQILVEMDGFERNENVIVIAATNRPDVLDPALLRPGRFDRKITLDLPDQDGRLEILKIHAQNKPLATDVDLAKVAKRTIGFSGADLENILNEAAIQAAKKGEKEISEKDLEEATIKVVMGAARKRRRTQRELETVAYHEAGHAVVNKFVPEADPIHKITIVSRGMSGGMTMHMPEQDETLTTRTKILSEIKVLLGGQVAEKLFIGDITTGASNDIERASKLARDMVKKFGMTELGLIRYGIDEEVEGYMAMKDYSELTSQEIDKMVAGIISNCYQETEKIISLHKEEIIKLRDMLLEKEVVSAEEYNEIFK